MRYKVFDSDGKGSRGAFLKEFTDLNDAIWWFAHITDRKRGACVVDQEGQFYAR